MTFLTARKTGSSILKALGTATLLSTLAGCALGNIELSGPSNEPNVVATANIHGKAIGGQNPLTYSTVDLYAVDNSAYGGGSHLLTNVASGTSQYYPGLNTTTCNNTALSPTAYFIVSGTATINAANSMIAGQLINISDSSKSGLNGTYTVASATGTSFTVSTNLIDDAGTPGGSYTPVCYTHPTTDQNGNFNVTGDYNCSTFGSSVVYLQGSGGNPGLATGTNNSSIVITALLQSSPTSTTALTCSQLSSANTVSINELTTAAMGIAMGQFFTTTFGGAPTADGFGAPNTTQAHTGITNAANTALELVSTVNGAANTSYALTNGSFSVTVTPESLKLQTIADILANCVNGLSANSNCTSMFTALSTGTAPTDTLQAAVLFGLNPTAGSTTNSTTLWNLVSGTSQPWTALSTQPADWTIGIQYTDTAGCTPPVTGTVGTCALNDPQNVVPDSSGNMWVINHNGSAGSSLTELSPVGAQIVTNNTIAGKDLTINNPRGLAIDTNDNPWTSITTSGNLLKYNALTPGSSTFFATTGSAYGPAIDGNNNVFFGFNSTSAKWSTQEVNGGDLTQVVEYPAFCSDRQTTYTACSPTSNYMAMTMYAAIDTNGTVWYGNSASSGTGTNLTNSLITLSGYSFTCVYVSSACQNGVSGATVAQTFAQVVGGVGSVPALWKSSGMAAGASGVMWVTNNGSVGTAGNDTIVKFTDTSHGTAFGSNASVLLPIAAAVDGAGNAWILNGQSSAHSVSEFSSNGTILSPTNTTVAPFITAGFQHNQILTPTGISVDPSGNVWVASNTATTGGVFEIVGVAAPTVTPISRALKNGTVGVKP